MLFFFDSLQNGHCSSSSFDSLQNGHCSSPFVVPCLAKWTIIILFFFVQRLAKWTLLFFLVQRLAKWALLFFLRSMSWKMSTPFPSSIDALQDRHCSSTSSFDALQNWPCSPRGKVQHQCHGVPVSVAGPPGQASSLRLMSWYAGTTGMNVSLLGRGQKEWVFGWARKNLLTRWKVKKRELDS